MNIDQCQVCKIEVPEQELFEADVLLPSMLRQLEADGIGWRQVSKICAACLQRVRFRQIQELMEDERGGLTSLEERVFDSLNRHEVISRNINEAYKSQNSFGERLSDRIAKFGGSWTFLISFFLFIFAWITLNGFLPGALQFDQYPYILLNLILSCLAAIQAPIIMMSQNRRENKDRIRNEHDYLINMKAELEVRQLHLSIDQLFRHQRHKLREMQVTQEKFFRRDKSDSDLA